MRLFPTEAAAFLVKSSTTDSHAVKTFFRPVFSLIEKEKEDEEIIIFNFHQFLKKLERMY